MDLKTLKKAHFIGIGGVGMSATAKLLKDRGVLITGSDEELYDPTLSYLKKEGLPYVTPYASANIPTDVDLIVIGKNAKLTKEANPEVAAAFASGKPLMSFPELLSMLSADKQTIVVAGSYGKTTSTALMAHCLTDAGAHPSYWIPAASITPAENTHTDTGTFFVLEGDEYPASNTDPRSKFLHYHPAHTLITPLAHDHFNIFPTPAEYVKPFTELVHTTTGTVVVCTEGPLSSQLLSHAPQAVTYGLTHGTYQAGTISWGEQTSFDITKDGQPVARVHTSLLGEHNIQNIVGVAALLFTLGAVTPEQYAQAVATFKGVVRRLDKKSNATTIPVYEGFGSSYEKARSAIDAMKRHFPTKRLVVLFEPHTFGWRNKKSLPSYDTAFKGVDIVYLLQPAEHGSGNQEESSFEEIVTRVTNAGVAVGAAGSGTDLLNTLKANLDKNDCILLLSSGPMDGLIETVPTLAEEKFPA